MPGLTGLLLVKATFSQGGARVGGTARGPCELKPFSFVSDHSSLSTYGEKGKQKAAGLPGGRVDRSELRGWWQSWKRKKKLGYEFTC